MRMLMKIKNKQLLRNVKIVKKKFVIQKIWS